jgi:hypothetical protein
MRRPVFERLLCAACVALFVGSLLRHLSVPLFWQDEGETAMFATRILEVGYPKVHGTPNVLYEFGAPREIGVKASDDAYLGKTWADFYFAVPGVWWAQHSADPYQRTLRVRLPFALVGAAGVCVWLWGVLPALPRSRQLGFASAYFALGALSISLVLHLREARYYPLLVGVLGALVALLRMDGNTPGVTEFALAKRDSACNRMRKSLQPGRLVEPKSDLTTVWNTRRKANGI